MKAVSVDIVYLLNAAGLGVSATDLFAMAWNEDIDAQTLVIDNPGPDSPMKQVYEVPGFQILVRGAKGDDLNTAYAKIRAVHEYLISQSSQTVDGTDYSGFEPISTIAGMGRDKNDRAVFSMNYYTFRNPT